MHPILFVMVMNFIIIRRVFFEAPHRNVSTIVFLSSLVEVLPLFTSMGITQVIGLFYPQVTADVPQCDEMNLGNE